MSGETLLIVGGGLAAARGVEAIRDGGHDGTVVLVGQESEVPYDRPPLSKAVLLGQALPETATLHPREWYDERKVDLHLGVTATRLDPTAHTLSLSDGRVLTWDRLLIATGSSVRRLDVPGSDLANVLYLRTRHESTILRGRLELGGNLVIVGAGWIGLEVASAARAHGCAVTVIEPQSAPLQGVLGPEVGKYFVDLHSSHGVQFRLGEAVERFEGEVAVSGVRTTSGEVLSADTVVVGVGITPNTALAESAGIEVNNGIVCDQALHTSTVDILAAGDVANSFRPSLKRHVRVDHWANADEGGYAAGRSMLGEAVEYDPVPYFFSDQYDVGLEYAGYVPRDAKPELLVRGDPTDNAFMAFWLSEGRLLAGMHVNLWDTIDDVKTMIRSGSVVDPQQLGKPN